MIIDRILRRTALGLGLGVLLAAAPALAVNDVYESSCLAPGNYNVPAPACTKLPKENLCLRQIGDLDANGAITQVAGTLAKGKKGTMLKVDMTFEWFTLSAQFRPFNLKLNGKFPIDFLILNHLDSCGNGACTRHATTWFDIDAQESVYPGQFYNQPLTITLDSAKAADANSSYNVTICAQTLKKK